MECSKCGKENDNNSKFCLRCGEILDKAKSQSVFEDDAILFCNECGHKIVENITSCNKCGHKFINGKLNEEGTREMSRVNKNTSMSKFSVSKGAVWLLIVIGLLILAPRFINIKGECESCGQIERLNTYRYNSGYKSKLCDDCYRLEKTKGECESCGQIETLNTYIYDNGYKSKLCVDCYRTAKRFGY